MMVGENARRTYHLNCAGNVDWLLRDKMHASSSSYRWCRRLTLGNRERERRAPPSLDCTQILPPCRSTIRLHVAKPSPTPVSEVPSSSWRNGAKTLSHSSLRIPIPLSLTEKSHDSDSRTADAWIAGVAALPIFDAVFNQVLEQLRHEHGEYPAQHGKRTARDLSEQRSKSAFSRRFTSARTAPHIAICPVSLRVGSPYVRRL